MTEQKMKVIRHSEQPILTKVTRQEELLYGPYAGLVRRYGRLVEEAEAAQAEVWQDLAGIREADELEMGKVHPSLDMVGGQSPIGRWMAAVSEDTDELVKDLTRTHAELARSCMERWHEVRFSPDSNPGLAPVLTGRNPSVIAGDGSTLAHDMSRA